MSNNPTIDLELIKIKNNVIKYVEAKWDAGEEVSEPLMRYALEEKEPISEEAVFAGEADLHFLEMTDESFHFLKLNKFNENNEKSKRFVEYFKKKREENAILKTLRKRELNRV